MLDILNNFAWIFFQKLILAAKTTKPDFGSLVQPTKYQFGSQIRQLLRLKAGHDSLVQPIKPHLGSQTYPLPRLPKPVLAHLSNLQNFVQVSIGMTQIFVAILQLQTFFSKSL